MKSYPNKKPSTKAVIAYLKEWGWHDAAKEVEEWDELYKADHPSKPRAKKEKKAEEPTFTLSEIRAIVRKAIKDSGERRLPLSEPGAYKMLLARIERYAGAKKGGE